MHILSIPVRVLFFKLVKGGRGPRTSRSRVKGAGNEIRDFDLTPAIFRPYFMPQVLE